MEDNKKRYTSARITFNTMQKIITLQNAYESSKDPKYYTVDQILDKSLDIHMASKGIKLVDLDKVERELKVFNAVAKRMGVNVLS